ncbi:MAG: hypothetical protein IJ518_04730 [Clostridia bacterium]|nr:hypothetical protein [Clostridia bacterium]
MGLFNKQPPQAPNQPQKDPLQVKYDGARSNLLLMVILTVVNFVLALAESDTYFLFSSSFPQFALGLGIGFTEAGLPQFMPVCIVIGVLSIALYFLCWLLSKKNPGWIIAAMVLFILDCVLLLVIGLSAELILDYLCHAWVLYYLISGVVAANKLKKQPPVPPVVAEGDPFAPIGYTADGQPVYPSQQTVVINGEPVDMTADRE